MGTLNNKLSKLIIEEKPYVVARVGACARGVRLLDLDRAALPVPPRWSKSVKNSVWKDMKCVTRVGVSAHCLPARKGPVLCFLPAGRSARTRTCSRRVVKTCTSRRALC